MKVNWNSGAHPISDIRDWSSDGHLELQPDYQRHEVWSRAAKIMLIDTILRNIPMPKIFLQSVLKEDHNGCKHTHRIVIDGQQRLTAVLGYLRDEFALDAPYVGEYSKKKFSELPETVQCDILQYKIDINEISGANPETIRDIYSRVNKYTVQLTKQELRRADFPGHFLQLSEELAGNRFFESNRIFTLANSRRMGDVEYVSELLALLLAGPQEKKDTLDEFYQNYENWASDEMERIKNRFLRVIDDLWLIWPEDGQSFAHTRFRQKSDLYALYNAIDSLRSEEYSLKGKNLEFLRKDMDLLDALIAPESNVQLFQRYAIHCVSQANALGSRKWRSRVLRVFLAGTYAGVAPGVEIVREFHRVKIAAQEYLGEISCPVCGQVFSDRDAMCGSKAVLAWARGTTAYQLSNSELLHRECVSEDTKQLYTNIHEYGTEGSSMFDLEAV